MRINVVILLLFCLFSSIIGQESIIKSGSDSSKTLHIRLLDGFVHSEHVKISVNSQIEDTVIFDNVIIRHSDHDYNFIDIPIARGYQSEINIEFLDRDIHYIQSYVLSKYDLYLDLKVDLRNNIQSSVSDTLIIVE